MFMAAKFVIAKTWKEPTCPLTSEWIKKITLYVYAQRNIIQPSNKKEVLPFVTTWMNLEDIMLSKISRSQTNK